jgi:hypothetical protein
MAQKKETEKLSRKITAGGGGRFFDGFITAATYVKDMDPSKAMILAAAAGCGPEYKKSEALKKLNKAVNEAEDTETVPSCTFGSFDKDGLRGHQWIRRSTRT